MVLPLPLNAVEHYMLADDSAWYPRCFVVVLRWNQPLIQERLEAAIEAATRRHPLLRALVEYEGDRPRNWIECPKPQYPIGWSTEPVPTSRDHTPQVAPIDLRRMPGLRFHVTRNVGGDRLLIQFHHACTDGLGAVRFVADLVTFYEWGASQAEARLPALNPGRLAARDAFGLTGWRGIVRWVYGTVGWLSAIEFLLHRPAPLGRVSASTAHCGGPTIRFCSRTLTADETSALVRAARRDGVTVNDLLIRDVFVALQAITEEHWPQYANAHKRIMVATNLRTRDDVSLPAANVVAMINLDRRPHRWTDARSFLRVIHWELTVVKRLRLGIVFVQILHTLQTLFGSLRRFLPDDRCQATCVVSNLGSVSQVVDSDVIGSVEFYPPIRPLTAAAIGVLTYRGQMTASLNYDASAISRKQADEFLDRVVCELRAYEKADAEFATDPNEFGGVAGGSTELALSDRPRSDS